MILKLVRRNVAATKGRLLLMLLSIVIGVSFVSGSFLLADSLRAIFSDVSEQIFAGVDVQVRAVESELATGEDATRFSDEVLDQVADLPEVEYAEGGLFAFEQIYTVDPEGEVNRPQGPPVLASSWAGPSPVSSWTLIDGRAPGPDEIVIDTLQAEVAEIAIGDTIPIVAPAIENPVEVTVVGTVVFGDEASGGVSPYFNLFDLTTMQTLMGAEGLLDGIALNAVDDVSNNQLIAAVEQATDFNPALEAVPGATLVQEQNDEFGEIIDIIGYVLLGFAVVVLFVSIFIIYNTFAILVSQRIRQFGLLRSVGMLGSQLTRMVFIEALIIGVLASILGLFGGIGIANLLKWIFATASDGGGFPDGPLVFRLRTIIIVFALGIGVTLGSAMIPAWLAQRIPALAALRDGAAGAESSYRRRLTISTVLLIAGVGLYGAGLFAGGLSVSGRLSLLGFGAVLLFLGAVAVSVFFAATVTRFIGAPIERLRGLTGRLGRDNASRNPQRTAATAAALMIGLALITGVLVLAASLRSTFDTILEDSVAADLFVYEEQQGLPFAGTAVDQLLEVPEIADVAGFVDVQVELDGEVTGAAGFDVASQDRVLNIGLVSGSWDAGNNGVLLYTDEAEDLGLGLGDSVNVTFEDDFNADFEIVGLFDDNTLLASDWVFDRSVVAAHSNINQVGFLGATFVEGVDPEAGQAAAEAAIANFPQLVVQNNTEFKETQEGQINAIVALINGLLFLCIIVAFIGIVNTMALSILERTREIGLLRAVGTTRNQLRSMVRWEALIVGVFGALMGVVLGLLIGVGAVTAIPDSFISEVSIPWGSAITFLILGGVLGVVAAFFPARRAAKMNVLDAISAI
ncbi:MAG: FtsX-like permease family protein [Actinomycetota bacterium]